MLKYTISLHFQVNSRQTKAVCYLSTVSSGRREKRDTVFGFVYLFCQQHNKHHECCHMTFFIFEMHDTFFSLCYHKRLNLRDRFNPIRSKINRKYITKSRFTVSNFIEIKRSVNHFITNEYLVFFMVRFLVTASLGRYFCNRVICRTIDMHFSHFSSSKTGNERERIERAMGNRTCTVKKCTYEQAMRICARIERRTQRSTFENMEFRMSNSVVMYRFYTTEE